ncbi:MAG: hypothetical protein WCP55_11395 [Lentisphaerota bacterium]
MPTKTKKTAIAQKPAQKTTKSIITKKAAPAKKACGCCKTGKK